MTVTIDSPATRADVLRLLMQGASMAATLRLVTLTNMQQLDRGFSYVLRDESGNPLGIAGFFPAVDREGEFYETWFLAGDGCRKHLARIVRATRHYAGMLAASGARVRAHLDPDHKRAPVLARLCGFVPVQVREEPAPLVEPAPHSVWAFDPANAEHSHG